MLPPEENISDLERARRFSFEPVKCGRDSQTATIGRWANCKTHRGLGCLSRFVGLIRLIG